MLEALADCQELSSSQVRMSQGSASHQCNVYCGAICEAMPYAQATLEQGYLDRGLYVGQELRG